MREDKFGDLSVELSVEIIQLTKELHTRHKMLSQIKLAEVQQVFAPVLPKVNTLTVAPILLQSCKFYLKKPMRQANGLKCLGKVITLTERDIKHLIASARQYDFCL